VSRCSAAAAAAAAAGGVVCAAHARPHTHASPPQPPQKTNNSHQWVAYVSCVLCHRYFAKRSMMKNDRFVSVCFCFCFFLQQCV
jgi:hypothetical protein